MIVKRIFDVICACFGIIMTSPIFLIIAGLIKREDSGPVFYRGVRTGRYGKSFRIFKFRAMVVDAEKLGVSSTSDDDEHITRIGKNLRKYKYKLDELPQPINVLKGKMSFVGPRPEVPQYVNIFTEEEKQYWMFVLELQTGPSSGIPMKVLFWQAALIRTGTISKKYGRRRSGCS